MRHLFQTALIAIVVAGMFACMTPSPGASAPLLAPAPAAPAPSVAPSAFRPIYWSCSVEITTLFAKMPAKARATLDLHKLGAADEFEAAARGTGVVIGKEGNTLLILTARHVVKGGDKVFVSKSAAMELPAEAEVKLADITISESSDLALLVVTDQFLAPMVEAVEIADSLPKVGDTLQCVGNALGVGLRVAPPGPLASDEPAFVDGEVYQQGGYFALPGNSGGGVFYNGKLVGVVSAILVHPTTRQYYSHMGFFVGQYEIFKFLKTLDK